MDETVLSGESRDIVSDNVSKLKEIFPEVITEDKIDFEKLKLILGEDIETDSERYSFTWPGKTQAIKESQKQSTGTLRPCKEESKNWDTTENLYIEGDNLEVLKLLQKSYYNKIKAIYIDPPYNTGKDFIYKDNYKDNLDNYLKISGQVASEDLDSLSNGIKMSTNTETHGRYHSNWLNMMYPRLKLARNLLKDDGAIFISIDDNEVENLTKICNEIFGEENFVSNISAELTLTQGMKVGAAQKGAVVKNYESILIYSKNKQWKVNELLYDGVNGFDTHFSIVLEENEGILNLKPLTKYINEDKDLRAFFEKYDFSISIGSLQELVSISPDFRDYFYTNYSNKIYQSMVANIFIPNDILEDLSKNDVVRYDKYILHRVATGKIRQLLPLSSTLGLTDDFLQEFNRRRIRGNYWKGFYKDMMNVAKEGGVDFKNGKKPVRLIEQLMKWGSDSSSIILDFFSGSSTTAHSIMNLNNNDNGNRRFIMVQIPEATDEKSEAYKAGFKNICEIGKERIRRAGDKIVEESGNKDLDIGFKVFKLDSSNLEKWDPDYNNLEQTLFTAQDNIKQDRTQEDLIYEIMLKYGIDLTLPIQKHETETNTIYSVGFGTLLICLDDNITKEIASEILKLTEDVEISRVVFKDNGFASDSDKTNIKEILKTNNIDEFITI